MVRIRRREPGAHERGPEAPWPDGRDPMPGVLDIDALGPLPRATPAAPAPRLRARPVADVADVADVAAAPDELPVADLEPDVEPAPDVEPPPEVDTEPESDWMALPDDLWNRPEDPYRPIFDEPIEPERDDATTPVVAVTSAAWDPAAGVAPAPPPPVRRDVSLASAALVMAFVVLLTGLLTAATGVADDESDAVATDETTTTSTGETTSTSQFIATIPGPTTTGTTSVPSSGTPAPPTTGPRITIPDRSNPPVRPPSTTPSTQPGETTTSTSTSTSLAHVNRPMTTEITAPVEAVAGDLVTFTVEWTDLDAVPTAGCIEVTGGDGIDIPASNCEDDNCADDPSIQPQGGTLTFDFEHTFATAGRYEITVSNKSGDPRCGNTYASEASETFEIVIVDAE